LGLGKGREGAGRAEQRRRGPGGAVVPHGAALALAGSREVGKGGKGAWGRGGGTQKREGGMPHGRHVASRHAPPPPNSSSHYHHQPLPPPPPPPSVPLTTAPPAPKGRAACHTRRTCSPWYGCMHVHISPRPPPPKLLQPQPPQSLPHTTAPPELTRWAGEGVGQGCADGAVVPRGAGPGHMVLAPHAEGARGARGTLLHGGQGGGGGIGARGARNLSGAKQSRGGGGGEWGDASMWRQG
jgi:hypothetical protein